MISNKTAAGAEEMASSMASFKVKTNKVHYSKDHKPVRNYMEIKPAQVIPLKEDDTEFRDF